MDKTGGSAFPQVDLKNFEGMLVPDRQPGMTLRDYFASDAMKGMLSTGTWFSGRTWGSVGAMADDYATEAYVIANAMIKARGQA